MLPAETAFGLAPLVIGFPLLALLINILLGQRLGQRLAGWVASAAVGLAFLVSVLQFIALQAVPEGTTLELAEWISIGSLQVPWALKLDSLSVTMMLMVTGVSTLIHIYAIGYMRADVRFQGDPSRYRRFFVFFSLFVTSMMVLVVGDSFLTLFVGWEGVGLCSYLLIGFWYEKGAGGIGNAVAGRKAFVVNRIGDLGFLIAMFLAFWHFGSLRFEQVFEQAETLGPAAAGAATAITLALLVGATGKSAQLPLFVWLPDAMAGPTPVSALIHAATMVTAGIYMIARNAVLFELAPISSGAVALVGAATALFAASIAVAQFDIKRVLAYSTISQLGFMIAAVGIGGYVAGMFHLVTHAFFKALLFLSAGSVIQGIEHGQHRSQGQEHIDPNDMRAMGGLRSRMPVTFAVYLIGGLALSGIPPLAGFFSKDEILTDAWRTHPVVFGMLSVAGALTAFYTGRQLWMVFAGQPRSQAAALARENPPIMLVPLLGLAGLSLAGGLINFPGLHPLGSFLRSSLEHAHLTEFDPAVAGLSTGLALLAFGTASWAYGRRPLTKEQPEPAGGRLWFALQRKWWVDELYNRLIVQPFVRLAGFLAERIDSRFWHDWVHDTLLARGFRQTASWLALGFDLRVIDGAGNALGQLTRQAALRLRALQTGYVRNYAISFTVGLVLMVGYLLLR
ncbi:MAG TPA: NADH-quinone oxidoreductase subunit L [Anaerolineales bacterium]|nr:NADH-quinone oxidoreductase subunit L [Anaerolineales bacterium]